MTDIAPELLEKVRQSFEAETAVLKEEIAKGVKNYEEAYSYAIKVGEALSRSFGVNITPEVLPDGRMYYNIADKVVRPMLMAEYNLTSEAAVSAQRSVNKAAGIGIRPLEAEFDAEKAQGIIDRVSSQPFDEVKWLLDEPVKSFSKNVVDQTLEKNVEFQGKSGLHPKIVRRASAGACKWCQAVAGTYEYPNVPKDVYRRHANCDCTVEYIDGGKYQDVWSKKVYQSKEEHDAAIQERIARAEERKAERQRETQERIRTVQSQKNELLSPKERIIGASINREQQADISLSTANMFNHMDELYERAKAVEPKENHDDVFIHGDEFGFCYTDADGKEYNLTPRELANILDRYGKLEEDNIRLCSCNTGEGTGFAAQALADCTGKTVLAPTKELWLSPIEDGVCEMTVCGSDKYGKPDYNKGEWKEFYPHSEE